MTYDRLTWLLPELRDAGQPVATVSGWESAGRPASTGHSGPYVGVGNHHTGTKTPGAHPTLGLVVRGRADLPGPLCHILLARTGVAWLVASGRANHAGLSNGAGLLATGDGNRQLVGIEVETSGVEQLTKAQRIALPLINAVILRKLGQDQDGVFLHATWSVTGKWDLAESGKTIDLGALRQDVRADLRRLDPPKPSRRETRLPVVDLSRLTHAARLESRRPRRAGDKALYPAGVLLVERELVNAGHLDKRLADGYYGPPTKRAVAAFQRELGYRGDDADGILGATSAVKLGLRGKDSFKVAA